MKYLKGTGVALVTPFNTDFSIDFISLEKLINYTIDGGVDFLVIMGTTGESVVLSGAEKQEILNFCTRIINNRLPLVLGMGNNNTLELINEVREKDLTLVDAILSVSPYYNKPTQDGIYLHYKMLAESTDLPIIIYNVPGRTASNIIPETTLRLSNDFRNIVAIKEASGDLTQISQILDQKPNDFIVLSGDDALTLKIIELGGEGVISVIGQSHPNIFSNMVDLALDGDYYEAEKLNNKLAPIYGPLYEDGNPAGIKFVLSALGVCKNILRPPLVPVSDNVSKKLNFLI